MVMVMVTVEDGGELELKKLLEELSGIADEELPRLVRVRWRRPSRSIPEEELEARVTAELERLQLDRKLSPGEEVALAVGSRGLAELPLIVRTVVQHLRALGARPFILPAMGAHGGASASGQRALLEKLGITEEEMGCPIRATMEVVELGRTESGLPVYFDSYAATTKVFLINRIRPHTAFSGRVGSGLLKLLAVGLGKGRGAKAIHRWGFELGLERAILESARVILSKAKVLGGLAIVEDFYHRPAIIEALAPEEFEEREAELLAQAKEFMPRLPFPELDLLIVDEAGKDLSGTGMDTYLIGRRYTLGEPEPPEPRIKRIYLRDLSPGSGGNALGIGLADLIHRRVLEKMDRLQTYINALSGTGPEKARIPPYLESDKVAIKLALSLIGPREPKDARVMWIKNTLELERFLISEALLPQARANPELDPELGGPQPLKFEFNERGDLLSI